MSVQMFGFLSRPKRLLHLILAGLVILTIAWLVLRNGDDDHLLLTDVHGILQLELSKKVY
jgi:hypothetical protein